MVWLNEDVYFDRLYIFHLGQQAAKKLFQIWLHISINVYNADLKKYILSLTVLTLICWRQLEGQTEFWEEILELLN